ncbi:MAG: sigma-54-dependent Fis family transcriptional regulator [Candidatus Krumholzibacteriota bacterium]|nr:sigma-54-dependent Fis family transcriptional regulator [Candidatus Krumholzibacteriota bacterium]
MPERILVVDDEASVRGALAKILRYEDYEVIEAADGPGALELVGRERLDLVFLDIKMPGMDGLEVLGRLAGMKLDLPVVIISGHGNVQTAVEATRLGAFDFLEKPLDADRVLVTLRNGLAQGRLRDENRDLMEKLRGRDEIIGESPAIRELLAAVERVAPTEARVLITGENGSGKELVARAIHSLSGRREGPFVPVNCAAIPNELIESELFGHEKGSFTGAHQRRIGKFEQAHRGLLFLDEVGDMDLNAQAKVLRVLQEGRLERVGGTVTIEVDVRVIAATNKNLLAEASENRFREDLYYRLNVVPLHVKPLRERPTDVPLLVRYFADQFIKEQGMRPKSFSRSAMERLTGYRWPGNVRELRNLVERLLIMSPGEVVEAADVTLGEREEGSEDGFFAARTFQDFKERSEAVFLRRKLAEWNGNISQTARALDMQRSNLYKKIEKYGLSTSKSPPSGDEG